MELTKASLNPEGGEPIRVLFNPPEYLLDRGNALAQLAVPGLGAPILQYTHGGGQTLQVELFLDTSEEGRDVREHTDRVYALLDIREHTHVPPVCLFRWGRFAFRCVVERVAGRFTLFLPDGTPVRAVLSVTLREAPNPQTEHRRLQPQSADHVKTRVMRVGESLSGVAAQEYGDPGLWRRIAQANGIDNPRIVPPGSVLVIPRLIGDGGTAG